MSNMEFIALIFSLVTILPLLILASIDTVNIVISLSVDFIKFISKRLRKLL